MDTDKHRTLLRILVAATMAATVVNLYEVQVSVSTSWSRDGLETCQRLVPRSRLDKNCQRLGLGHLRLVSKTNSAKLCRPHKKISYRRDNARRLSLSRSRSIKVTNFFRPAWNASADYSDEKGVSTFVCQTGAL